MLFQYWNRLLLFPKQKFASKTFVKNWKNCVAISKQDLSGSQAHLVACLFFAPSNSTFHLISSVCACIASSISLFHSLPICVSVSVSGCIWGRLKGWSRCLFDDFSLKITLLQAEVFRNSTLLHSSRESLLCLQLSQAFKGPSHESVFVSFSSTTEHDATRPISWFHFFRTQVKQASSYRNIDLF